MRDTVGSVAALWRFPVKSMLGETLDEAEIGEQSCRAGFVEPPSAGAELPPVRISLPDGASVTSDQPGCDAALSRCFGREVRLATSAPEDFTIDQYHPDVEGIDPAGHRDTVVEQKLGSAFFGEAGTPSLVPVGAFFDLFRFRC